MDKSKDIIDLMYEQAAGPAPARMTPEEIAKEYNTHYQVVLRALKGQINKLKKSKPTGTELIHIRNMRAKLTGPFWARGVHK